MKPSEIAEIVEYAIKSGNHAPMFIWGPPGVGKSSVVQAVARELGIECLDLRMTLMDLCVILQLF